MGMQGYVFTEMQGTTLEAQGKSSKLSNLRSCKHANTALYGTLIYIYMFTLP